MTTPAKLSGVATTVTIDGVDMHTMGMLVTSVSNPVPDPLENSVQLPGRNGPFDFTKTYGSRSIMIQGHIIADTHAQLRTNVDSIKAALRLRQNLDSMKVIFQDQTDRYWTCRYEGGFYEQFLSRWYFGRVAKYTLVLRCVKPYAEAVTPTTETFLDTIFKTKSISYAGTLPTPLTVKVQGHSLENLLEKAADGDASEDNTEWTLANCTGSDEATGVYGNWVKFTRTAPGAFNAEIDVTAEIDPAKWYVFGTFLKNDAGTTVSLLTTGGGGGGGKTSAAYNTSGQFNFVYVKVGPTELGTPTTVVASIDNDGAATYSGVDGSFIYEITEAEYDDATYIPPPYTYYFLTVDGLIDLIDPDLHLSRGANLFPHENGSDVADWTGTGTAKDLESVTDPLGTGDRCWMFVADSTADTAQFYSKRVYVSGGKTYKLSFKYFCEHLSTADELAVYVMFYREDGAGSGSGVAPVQGTEWTSVSTTYEIAMTASEKFTGAYYAIVKVELASGGHTCRFYIKDIMIEEYDGVAYAAAYEKPNILTQNITGTVDNDDDVLIDNERMVSTFQDWSAKTLGNGASYVSGNRLMLEPGTNLLKLTDAREGSATPEIASSGCADITLSYRARYL